MTMKKVTETRIEPPATANTSQGMAEDVRERQTGSKDGLHEWQAVLPHSVQLEPRSVLVTRAKITDSRRTNIQKSLTKGKAPKMANNLQQAVERKPRTLRENRFIHSYRSESNSAKKESADSDKAGHRPKESVDYTTQQVNSRNERITPQRNQKVVNVYDIRRGDVREDGRQIPSYARSTNTYHRQRYPTVREQNARIANWRERKLAARDRSRKIVSNVGQQARYDGRRCNADSIERERCRSSSEKRAKRIRFRPGQLVYRKQMTEGREPKWFGPYQVIRKVTDSVYEVQIGKREISLHVDQLKLCTTSREELRERRRENRRRIIKEQMPYFKSVDCSDSNSDYSSESADETDFVFTRRSNPVTEVSRNEQSGSGSTNAGRSDQMSGVSESQHVSGGTAEDSKNPVVGDERDEIVLERDNISETAENMAMPSVKETGIKGECRNLSAPDSNEMSESNVSEHGYMLRPRVKHSYKE
jgi:hypothetical protein